MSDDAQRWKSKYLESLEQQEKLERRWEARLDLLRRGLVRSSLAAEGSDKSVDQCMQELRETLRRDDIDAGLAALIPRLEKAVLDSEKRRQERIEQNISGVTNLTAQLLALQPPREVRKALKQFSRRIEERASQPRELPALLTELSGLQQQALAVFDGETATTRPGLLQRLFGNKDAQPDTADIDSAVDGQPATGIAAANAAENLLAEPAAAYPPAGTATEPPAVALVSPTPAPLTPHEPVAESPRAVAEPTSAALMGDPAYALPEVPEPGYSSVAPHIGESLMRLLDELELPERHKPQGEVLRLRVQGGLNWYELVAVLDDLAVLILAVTDSGQREFATYLKQLNERLALFLDTLTEAHEGYSESVESARTFNQELRDQVSGLQASVQEAVDLHSLKQSLEARLDGLLNTVSAHQKHRDGREEEVAQRLQSLTQKVADMEREAQSFRDHLEEQRQKALIDPLTGLPNRAGWSERLELEMARWKRYGGELALAVLDIDHFKRINDGYGHLAGDKVLKIIAGELAKRLRKTDFIARFGGEEFVLLIPSTPLEGGRQLLQTLLDGVEQCPFHFRGERVTITLSAGLTVFANGESSEKVFERADQALYRAKSGGRNRVELG
ncbi:GGDEF domain-containing protein [Pseudomonas sp. HMWF032]|uniref:GGDEF domain-containing protein n=1 Tax=unclassified Pseudomonas TaxID=196821 RepID=UPI000D3CE193|nr:MULTISPECIES: diguanylate cyclase [unclassified Pseudomonas]PTS82302.1 GGDEF domain-containing protein [Pseudomonas sp. HMWF032]PTT85547.1 GGDEF domain-containing protein [Pseudomonas sp. HMWF010]